MLLREKVRECRAEYEERRRNPSFFSGLVTFFPELDRRLRGLRRREVTFLAGVSGVGKSAFALYVTAMNFYNGHLDPERQAVLYVSAEMPYQTVVMRLVSVLTGVPGALLQTGLLQESATLWTAERGRLRERKATPEEVDQEVFDALARMENWSLDVRDRAQPTTFDIERWLKELTQPPRAYDVPLVVIDHIGRIADDQADPTGNAAQAHQGKLNRLAELARRYNTHMLVIHDLTAEATRRNGPPRFSDLKGGSGSQYDPDNVIVVHSDQLEEARNGGAMVPLERIHLQVFVYKNRHGGIVGPGGVYEFAPPAGYYAVDWNKARDLLDYYASWRVPYVEPERIQ